MAILLLTQNYPPSKGGMAVSCSRIVKNLRRKNICVHVFHFTNRRKPFYTETKVNGTYTALPINKSEEFTLSLASEFIQTFIKDKKVAHLGAFGGMLPLNLAPILSKWCQIPLITFIRGNDFDEGIFSKRREKLLFALNHSEHIFTVTQEKKDKISALVQHKNIHFTPNGIDASLWQIGKSQQKKVDELKSKFTKKTIAIIGQLKPKKGILNFCKIFDKFPYKEEYQFCLIGDVAPEIKEEINAFDFNVSFFPFAKQNELITFYHAFNIFAIPSFYDGMPNVLLEAGVCHNLVMGSNLGGMKDVIENEKDGFLFNPLHPTELIDVLLKVHRMTREQREEMKQSLYQKITTKYTQEKEITNYLNILNYED